MKKNNIEPIEELNILTLPNLITSLRLVGTAAMLFTEVFSGAFFVIYTFCGFTDVLDGFIARRWNLSSRFGAKLDSIADLSFYAVMLIKVFPFMWKHVARWIWIIIFGLMAVRLVNYIWGWRRYGELVSIHTYLNKASGFAVFAVPYFLHLAEATAGCCMVCAVAGLATFEEVAIHLLHKGDRPPEAKSLFLMKQGGMEKAVK